MPELSSKATHELVITPRNQPSTQFTHTQQWAQTLLRTTVPGSSSDLTNEGVLVATVPSHLTADAVQHVLGQDFLVAPNQMLRY